MIILLAALVLLLLFRYVPLTVSLRLVVGPELRGKITVGGLLPISFPKAKSKAKPKPSKQKKEGTGAEKTKGGGGRVLRLFLEDDFRRRAGRSLWRFMRRIFRAVKIRGLKGKVVYGSGDPSETGRLLGKYYAGRYALFPMGTFEDFILTPDFKGKKLEGEFQGKVLIYLGRIAAAVLLFLVEWPLMKTWAAWRRSV